MTHSLPSEPPELLSAELDDGANLLTLTFDQLILAGSISFNNLKVEGVGAVIKAAVTGPFDEGLEPVIGVANQISGTSGSPRITWNTPTTVFLNESGLPAPVFTDFPINVI